MTHCGIHINYHYTFIPYFVFCSLLSSDRIHFQNTAYYVKALTSANIRHRVQVTKLLCHEALVFIDNLSFIYHRIR